jgi:DNA repair protein RecO (recombination protein O)
MIHLKDAGFVIRRTNISDSDRFITLYTQHNGKVEVLAKGVRRINSRRAPHVELLNLIKFQAVKTRKNFILTDIEGINTNTRLKQDYEKVGTVFLLCELINKLCPEGLKHEDIFFLLKDTIEKIGNTDDFTSLLYDFQVRLLTILGFWDPSRKLSNQADIDRYIENVMERKIRTKLFFKL